MVWEPLEIVTLQEGQSWASFQQLIKLVWYIDKSSNFKASKELKSFRSLILQLITINQIVHALISNILTACQDKGLQI